MTLPHLRLCGPIQSSRVTPAASRSRKKRLGRNCFVTPAIGHYWASAIGQSKTKRRPASSASWDLPITNGTFGPRLVTHPKQDGFFLRQPTAKATPVRLFARFLAGATRALRTPRRFV